MLAFFFGKVSDVSSVLYLAWIYGCCSTDSFGLDFWCRAFLRCSFFLFIPLFSVVFKAFFTVFLTCPQCLGFFFVFLACNSTRCFVTVSEALLTVGNGFSAAF